MQVRKENERLGICHRFFNFIISSLIGRGMKRVSLGHQLPEGSTNQGQLDEYARNEVQEPLISHAKANREERLNSKLKDDSDSAIQIHFKRTEELEYWTPIDDLNSSVHEAAKDEKEVETSNKFTDLPGKAISLSNGISAIKSRGQGKTQVLIQGEGSRGPKMIIPITDSVGHQEEKKRQIGNKFPSPNLTPTTQPDTSKPILTGLGLTINEISEIFIQNTRERMSRKVNLIEREES